MSAADAQPDDATVERRRELRSGRAAVILLTAIAGVVTVIVVGAGGSVGERAGAQTSVSPVLSCPGSMALDAQDGQCRTPRTETVLRPSSCSSGSTRVPGQYGGHECQRRVQSQRNTGRTRQVYSHTTYNEVWVPTGTERRQTGTSRVWVPPRTMTEPLVPPVRVQVGTERRCDFDVLSGQHFNCRNVPVYGWQGFHTVTVPGYWDEEPVYSQVETGYFDRVPTIHYTTEPVYETVVEWQTTSPSVGPCAVGWQPAGSQCQRTVLGEPSAAPHQSCPTGSTPRYGDGFGGGGPSVLLCESGQPGTNLDNGVDQEQSGGPMTSLDGGTRPLHHLAGESDERLAELGIHRCADGLLSYVACSELPGREWDSDSDVCDEIEGTVYRPDHGGSCVTANDLLNKCTTPGDCETTTIRTYCPAIGELVHTEIQEHVHLHRGAETYRVCIFECANFGTLPSYVQLRINGSNDYACRPSPQPEPDPTAPTTTTTRIRTSTTRTTTAGPMTTTSSPATAGQMADQLAGLREKPDPRTPIRSRAIPLLRSTSNPILTAMSCHPKRARASLRVTWCGHHSSAPHPMYPARNSTCLAEVGSCRWRQAAVGSRLMVRWKSQRPTAVGLPPAFG